MPYNEYTVSRILSYLLHPLLIPTYATIALLLRPDVYTILLPYSLKFWILSVVVVFTFLIPVAGVLMLQKLNVIHSFEIKEHSQRTIPLLFSAISYIVLLFLIRPSGIPPVLLFVLYSATVTLLVGLLINLAFKISLHTLGWSGITCTLTCLSLQSGLSFFALIVSTILVSGVAGYARLKQNAHNQAQIYAGYVAGACIILLLFLLV
jgi:hypothetical protein